jgi:hypothetical protein
MQAFSGVLARGSVTRITELRNRVCGTKDGLIKAAAAFHDRYDAVVAPLVSTAIPL